MQEQRPNGRRGLKRMVLAAVMAWSFVILGTAVLTQPERVEHPAGFIAYLLLATALAGIVTARVVALTKPAEDPRDEPGGDGVPL